MKGDHVVDDEKDADGDNDSSNDTSDIYVNKNRIKTIFLLYFS